MQRGWSSSAATTPSSTAAGSTIVDDVADGAETTYTAVSYDDAGNASSEVTVRVRTPDRTPPDEPFITRSSDYPVHLAISAESGATIGLRRNGEDAGADVGIAVTDSAATDTEAPEAPSGLRTAATTTDGFDIAWEASPDVASMYLYRARATDAAGNASGWGEIAARRRPQRHRRPTTSPSTVPPSPRRPRPTRT